MKSSLVTAATPEQPTEATWDDADGAGEFEEVSLDGQNLADQASPVWRPRLLAPPVLGNKAPAKGQQ